MSDKDFCAVLKNNCQIRCGTLSEHDLPSRYYKMLKNAEIQNDIISVLQVRGEVVITIVTTRGQHFTRGKKASAPRLLFLLFAAVKEIKPNILVVIN